MYTAAYVCLNLASWLLYTPIKLLLLLLPNNLGISDTSHQQKTTDDRQKKQAVGGRPPRYAPAQACNGSAQRQPWASPAELGPISQYAPSSRPAAHAARRPDVRDRRQTDRRQTSDSIIA